MGLEGGTGIWTQELGLARQALYYVNDDPSPFFALGYFSD
jgi:hypothetical protein